MLSVGSVKRKIRSIKNIRQITRAMMLVAASKMKKAETAILSARPYAKSMEQIMASVAMRAEKDTNPLLTPREVQKQLVVMITSQRGLCGGFNASITKNTFNFLMQQTIPTSIICIGQKGMLYFKHMDWEMVSSHSLPDKITYEGCQKIAGEIIELYLSHGFDRIYVSYNEFKSVFQQCPIIKQFIPIEPVASSSLHPDRFITDYLYEPSVNSVIEELLAQDITIQIQRILLESAAAEHSARMVAMESATKSAGEMIDALSLSYNRARQAGITKEITEIVGAAEALAG
ncbi:ATP synthase F1 subunit gamma [Candidatus Desantisbacteria bacterium]|nr:ATP synthase F1 subunit gamma [Candidatus Desantisbacteria bacterium]